MATIQLAHQPVTSEGQLGGSAQMTRMTHLFLPVLADHASDLHRLEGVAEALDQQRRLSCTTCRRLGSRVVTNLARETSDPTTLAAS